MDTRPYDAKTDTEALWALKEQFERGLGENTGGDDKQAVYDQKLTAAYRERYLGWVDRCISEDPRSVTLAISSVDDVVGYVFVLPESLSFIWDAAILNELYLHPAVRGSGAADLLLDAAIETARAQSLPLDRIVLDVDRKNDRAQAFYKKHGFEHWGEMVARSL
ncbi:GNAT family N-acetyltransferase [Natronocalculus amylovorans]|uniref:GNAT family N-acetyltransferase n=1 Tax=Natronocalculus amylovorans TaxID=2917812 RepID=A0AAE3FWX1_9EURY|nr:GNAT family N-acetyltransferase [Natronocalculus amylovorans]MCL9816696.1 GNAT family N-acetyltransferase [Natronocalculus amylovorans]NUE01139.1 GNAT family N-acetyltransferase [Halorubraceae archaeon YAN]